MVHNVMSLTFSGALAAMRRFATSALPFSAAVCSAVSPRSVALCRCLFRGAVARRRSTPRPPAEVFVGRRRDVGVALQQKVHDGRVDQRRAAPASGGRRRSTAAVAMEPQVLLVEERRVLAQVVPDDPELAEERCHPDVFSASVPYEVSHGVSVF